MTKSKKSAKAETTALSPAALLQRFPLPPYWAPEHEDGDPVNPTTPTNWRDAVEESNDLTDTQKDSVLQLAEADMNAHWDNHLQMDKRDPDYQTFMQRQADQDRAARHSRELRDEVHAFDQLAKMTGAAARYALTIGEPNELAAHLANSVRIHLTLLRRMEARLAGLAAAPRFNA